MADVILGGTVSAGGSPFPIVRDTELLGGMRVVADIATRDAIIAADLKVGMLVCVQSDAIANTIYQLTSTGPNVWTRLASDLSIAGWSSSLVGFVIVDYDAGDDTHGGFIYAAANTVFTPTNTGPIAIKTVTRLAQIVPPNGNNRDIQILIKPRANGADYMNQAGNAVDALDLTGIVQGSYRRFGIRGSDLTNSVADKATCGGIAEPTTNAAGYNPTTVFPLTITDATNATPIVITTSAPHGLPERTMGTVAGVGGNTAANGNRIFKVLSPTTIALVGTAGNGSYTSGGTITTAGGMSLQLAGGGAANLTADPGLAYCRFRRTSDNASLTIFYNTSASLNYASGNGAFAGGALTSDTFVIEIPGVAFGGLTIGMPGSAFLAIAGLRMSAGTITVTGGSGASSSLYTGFCSALNSAVVWSNIHQLQVSSFFVDEGGTVRNVGGNRFHSFQASHIRQVAGPGSSGCLNTSSSTISSLSNCHLYFNSSQTGTRFLHPFELRESGLGTIQGPRPSSFSPNRYIGGGAGSSSINSRQPTFGPGNGNGDLVFRIQNSHVDIRGMDFATGINARGGVSGNIQPIGMGMMIAVSSIFGEGCGAGGVVLDLYQTQDDGAHNCTVCIGPDGANTAGGSTPIAVAGGTTYTSWTAPGLMGGVQDGHGNIVIDSATPRWMKRVTAGTWFNMPHVTADPVGSLDGDSWYRSDTHQFCVQEQGGTIRRFTAS